jgi:VanZ family protein
MAGRAATSREARRWVDLAIWAWAVGAVALTLWFSLGPVPPGHGSDKQLHALAYFVDTLALLLAVVWRPGRSSSRLPWAFPIVLAMLVLGGVIELAQAGFVHRDAQLGDWLADAVGIALALVAFTVLWRVARARNGPGDVS